MILHAGKTIVRNGGAWIRTTTVCGRSNARSKDGMNIAGDGEKVTCKHCLAALARCKGEKA